MSHRGRQCAYFYYPLHGIADRDGFRRPPWCENGVVERRKKEYCTLRRNPDFATRIKTSQPSSGLKLVFGVTDRARRNEARGGRGLGGVAPFPLNLVCLAHSEIWRVENKKNYPKQQTTNNKKQKTLRFVIPPASIFRSIQVNSGKLTFQCVFIVTGLLKIKWRRRRWTGREDNSVLG